MYSIFLPIDQSLLEKALEEIEVFHQEKFQGSDSIVLIEAYREKARRLEASQIAFQNEIAHVNQNVDGNASGN